MRKIISRIVKFKILGVNWKNLTNLWEMHRKTMKNEQNTSFSDDFDEIYEIIDKMPPVELELTATITEDKDGELQKLIDQYGLERVSKIILDSLQEKMTPEEIEFAEKYGQLMRQGKYMDAAEMILERDKIFPYDKP